jgi:hypothetical protein
MDEPVNERPMFPSPVRDDSLGFSIWSGDMVRQLTTVFQQYGYRLNQALTESRLDVNSGEIVTVQGDPVLREGDLDVNSRSSPYRATPWREGDLDANGTIPEVDRDNTFSNEQSFTNPIVLDGEGWNTPTLLNGWVNYGGSFHEARYRKLPSGLVEVRGLIKDGTTTSLTVLFNLPAGYRPAAQLIFATLNSSNLGRMDVTAGGDVVFVAPSSSSGWFSVNCCFFADQ